ncbi:hypothetical protein CDAR_24351 [Caerostris darwini]|uniref:Uncharacterized protein n=1 Tax=Caerostris darwini TaxID=1538125 RepID=A0AAV4QKJ4_9ARAC|nr:hypothetical protein CDAR_24351 [Caerostris darwini]
MPALKASLMDSFCKLSRIFFRKSSWKPLRKKSERRPQDPSYAEVGNSLALPMPALKISLLNPFCELSRIYFQKRSWKSSRMKSKRRSQEPGYAEVGKSWHFLCTSHARSQSIFNDPFCELSRISFRKSSWKPSQDEV